MFKSTVLYWVLIAYHIFQHIERPSDLINIEVVIFSATEHEIPLTFINEPNYFFTPSQTMKTFNFKAAYYHFISKASHIDTFRLCKHIYRKRDKESVCV